MTVVTLGSLHSVDPTNPTLFVLCCLWKCFLQKYWGNIVKNYCQKCVCVCVRVCVCVCVCVCEVSLETFVHNLINLIYYEHWADNRKYFYNFLWFFFLLFSFEALDVKKLSQQNLSNLNFLFLPIFTHTKVVKSSTTLWYWCAVVTYLII